MDDATKTFSTEFDTDILGLKFELISLLTDAGLGWFVDYTDVDCCLTESTLSLRVLTDHRKVSPSIKTFCRRHSFQIGCFDRETGRLTLLRIKQTNGRRSGTS
jgi:hypothetical protein